jgi:hypothetical protein
LHAHRKPGDTVTVQTADRLTPCQRDKCLQAGADVGGAAGQQPLVAEAGHGHAPAVSVAANPLLDRNYDVVAEKLAEVLRSRDFDDRPPLDARRVHRDDEERDAGVLRVGATRAGEQEAPRGPIPDRRPTFCPLTM